MAEGNTPKLLVEGPDQQEQTYELNSAQAYTIGRAPDNQVVLMDPAISRQHVKVEFRQGAWWIEDMGSRNGTQLGGKQLLAPEVLIAGDQIKIGSSTVVFSPGESMQRVRMSNVEESMTVHAMDLQSILGSSMSGAGMASEPGVEAPPDELFHKINRVSQQLLLHCELSELMQKIVDLVGRELKPDRVALLFPDGESGDLVLRASYQARGDAKAEILVSHSITQQAIQGKKAILVSDAQSDQRFHEQHSVVLQNIQSALCVPLWNDHEVIGLLYADKLSPIMPFAEEELRLLTLIGHLAAVKIRETEGFEELQKRKMIEEEMKSAAKIQQQLLPDAPIVRETYSVAGCNVPSLDVGGDYFDLIECSDGGLLFALGDVSGKGMAAALLTASVHANVHALSETGLTLAEMAARLNKSLYRSLRGERFVTLFLARYEPETGRLGFVNAGHNYPMLLRADDTDEELVEGGLMLGAFPMASFEEGSVTLERGDQLLVYSDGVTEAERAEDDDFGEVRLLAWLREHRTDEPGNMVTDLIKDVHKFVAPAKPGDDITAVVLRRL